MTNSSTGAWGAKCVVLVLVLGSLVHAQSSAWKPAEAGYQYSFPRDHAAHPDNKIEWWYYTGNVKTADGRRFGYQITFFRVGIDHTPANPGTLRSAQLAISLSYNTLFGNGLF